MFAAVAAVLACVIDQTYSPRAQIAARYHAIFVSVLLATAVLLALQRRVEERVWLHRCGLAVVLALCIAQWTWDVAATLRWRAYLANLGTRLSAARGLVPWELAARDENRERQYAWTMMSLGWNMPSFCIAISNGAPVRSLIAAPLDSPWQPFDPLKPEQLPKIRGVDYTPYLQALSRLSSNGTN